VIVENVNIVVRVVLMEINVWIVRVIKGKFLLMDNVIVMRGSMMISMKIMIVEHVIISVRVVEINIFV
jgi:hypothetical protein